MGWDVAGSDVAGWDGMERDWMGWDGIGWGGMGWDGTSTAWRPVGSEGAHRRPRGERFARNVDRTADVPCGTATARAPVGWNFRAERRPCGHL